MNDEVVKNIINVVKTSADKQVTYKALVKLRTDLVKDREGISKFRKCGGIQATVPLLHRTHEKILEVTLSILGNSCTEPESCEVATECKIVPPVIAIMKNIANSVIQCRACRLLGNLIREKKVDVTKHSKTIAQSLCLILEESIQLATTMMAARAARFTMLDSGNFIKEFVGSNGVQILMNILTKHLKNNETNQPMCLPECTNIGEDTGKTNNIDSIGLKVSQHREKYFQGFVNRLEIVTSDNIFDYETPTEKKQTNNFKIPDDKSVLDLITECLKCLQILSDVQSNVPYYTFSANEMGVPCIVFLAEDTSTLRSQALKILSNLSKNPLASSIVNEADVISAACNLITTKELKNSLSETEEKHCYNIICLLSGASCNRAKIRRSGTLPKLLEKAKSCVTRTEIASILYALNNFQYDNLSMHLMLSKGLVDILIRELDIYLNSDECIQRRNEQKQQRAASKRRSENSPSKNCKSRKLSPDLLCEPESPVSPVSLNPLHLQSPCSSRSLSPVSMSSKFEEDECASETYSPVCSDNDDDDDMNDEEDESKPEKNSVMQLLTIENKTEHSDSEDNISDKEDDEDLTQDIGNANSPVKSIHKKTVNIIENILFRASTCLKQKHSFGRKETILTIVEAIKVFGCTAPGFTNTLSNILYASEFFLPLIKQDVLYPIYQITKIEGLEAIGRSLIWSFAAVGESGYGRGELNRMLSKGDIKLQKQAAICTGFILRTKKIMYPLLTEFGALKIILTCILSQDEEYQCEAAAALTVLSQSIDIKLPECDLTSFNSEEFNEENDFPSCDDSDDTMKFVLDLADSQVSVEFDKNLVTKSSEVFDSMLNSDFRERSEKEVHLKNISVHGIKYFLNILNLEYQGKPLNIPAVNNFSSILEAYGLARMYILTKLEEQLLTLVIHRLSELSVLKVFVWALENFHPKLLEISVNYFLCSDIDDSKKVSLFKEANSCKYSKEWNDMIIDAVLDHCKRGWE